MLEGRLQLSEMAPHLQLGGGNPPKVIFIVEWSQSLVNQAGDNERYHVLTGSCSPHESKRQAYVSDKLVPILRQTRGQSAGTSWSCIYTMDVSHEYKVAAMACTPNDIHKI